MIPSRIMEVRPGATTGSLLVFRLERRVRPRKRSEDSHGLWIALRSVLVRMRHGHLHAAGRKAEGTQFGSVAFQRPVSEDLVVSVLHDRGLLQGRVGPQVKAGVGGEVVTKVSREGTKLFS